MDSGVADFTVRRTEAELRLVEKRRAAQPTNWTPELIADLTRLWGEGRTASKIGTVLGVSRSAVIGKARRLGLAGRPSPIKRNLSSPEERRERELLRKRTYYYRRTRGEDVVTPAVVRRAMTPTREWTLSATATCQYIEHEPSADDACKCGQSAIEGKAWCPSHYELVYTPYVMKPKAEAA